MDPEEVLDEIEHEVEIAEHDLEELEEGSETSKQRHETAENLLQEIHEQIDFLREVAEDGNQ